MTEILRRSSGPVLRSLSDLPNASQAVAEIPAAAATSDAEAVVESLSGYADPPLAPDPAGAAEGDHVTIALTFSTTVGAPEKDRARFVVKTASGEKAQKLESFIGSEQAGEVLMKLLRNDAPDLHRIAARFFVDSPQK